MINNIQLPIVICCSPRVHSFTRPDTMVPSVSLWHRFARFRNGVGFTQLALFRGGTYFELLVYISEASTLGFSEAVDPLLFLPLSSVFSLVFSAVKALILPVSALHNSVSKACLSKLPTVDPLGKLIWRSIQNGPTPHPQITVTEGQGDAAVQVTRDKWDEEFTEIKNNKELADIQATNILSQGLPRHVFNILNQTRTVKEIWDN
ncbi:hypothetical protein Tco_0137284, partial [Tanacetum coccineum]